LRSIFIVILLLLVAFAGQAQNTQKVIQFTGVVFTPDSTSVIPGVHIYAPKAGRGTTTNSYGFFSMAVLEGDSLVFSSVGFKHASFVVPAQETDRSIKLLLTLEEDIAFLEEVEIFPYPSEAMFKKAVLALDMSDSEDYRNMQAWLAAQYMARGYRELNGTSRDNYNYTMTEQRQAYGNRFQAPVNNFANPFAWARFIKDMRGGR
jgi:hypothetical protein